MKVTYQIPTTKMPELLDQCLATIIYALKNDPFGSYPLICLESSSTAKDIYPPPHPLCFTGSFTDLVQVEKEARKALEEGKEITFLTAMKGWPITFNKYGEIQIEAPFRFMVNFGGSKSYVPTIIRRLEDEQAWRIKSTLGSFSSWEEYYQFRKKKGLACHWDWDGKVIG